MRMKHIVKLKHSEWQIACKHFSNVDQTQSAVPLTFEANNTNFARHIWQNAKMQVKIKDAKRHETNVFAEEEEDVDDNENDNDEK